MSEQSDRLTTAAETDRDFGVRRVGLRWEATFTTTDGLERPLPGGLRFWRKINAHRQVMAALVMWNDGLWAAGGHPLQIGDT